jgi:hypothetical protein
MRALLTISMTAMVISAAPRGLRAQECNSGSSSGAANCQLPVVATARINAAARLSITTTATTLVTPKAADFGTATGVTTTGPSITVLSNAGYTLTASAGAATWTGPTGTSKPASDLRMNTGTVVPLGQVGTSNAGTAGTTYNILYNTIYNWTIDKPGTYSLVVNYTLTAP